ncbi:DUF5677 domain-containing protein [Luteibacter sp. 3190]|uniref:DUF5677 domain-containing protein n=1 Tax=Luteibacter sp. 3190 TaxID=2817736 RepID=UPI0028571803|nr:DUF5677 domain-containing protein [Luteibacter sp. 3190]MDR6936651.1 hypothetical protein [Luteibacter sp. 3190]
MLEETMHSLLDEAIHRILANAVDHKLRAVGLGERPDLRDALLAHVRSDTPGPLHFEDEGPDRTVDLTFSDAEMAAMEVQMNRVIEGLPEIIQDAAEAGAEPLYDDLWRRWPQERRHQTKDRRRFVRNLSNRWIEMFDGLSMLLTVGREHGQAVTEAANAEPTALTHVCAHLFARILQVASECVTLLDQGYADGALARWRTLHEASVLLVLMNEFGLPLAERYLAHQAVDAWQEQNASRHVPQNPLDAAAKPLGPAESAELLDAYNAAIALYGPSFKKPYGWGNGLVPKADGSTNALGFADLAAAAGRAALAEEYKFASYNVHPTARSFDWRLGLMGRDGLLIGASNAGLELPGARVAESLTLAIAFFTHNELTFDCIMVTKIAQRLRDRTIKAALKACDQLRRDEDALNRIEDGDDR